MKSRSTPLLDADNSAPVVLSMSHVGLRYDNGPEILSDLNLTLQPGSFSFLTGPSGAGKTSLLKLIYLALQPSRGFVHLFGQDTSMASRDELAFLRRKIGVVFQGFGLLNHLSVFENVALPLRITGRSHASYEDDIQDLLHWVGLGQALDVSPATLSGGEKQRVAIARAVVAKPELLIADEPTGNVDPEMGKRLMRLFVELNRLGSTVLIATHDMSLVKAGQADTYTLRDGELRLDRAKKQGASK
ncbi:Cell-division-associated, ABC-transporter-like signaling protein FtsE [hydrothermal vent metagenome]|uniref:Cell division ATP-binding protein FtsE n=1 Tax=hydrothermal vent metagenome TaxID=652676 RepID=A0A3B0SDG3_9ZZZZ